MKTKVIKEDCIACGNCSAICPSVYDYDEDGIAYNFRDNNTMEIVIDDDKDLILEAYENCPTQAIVIEEN